MNLVNYKNYFIATIAVISILAITFLYFNIFNIAEIRRLKSEIKMVGTEKVKAMSSLGDVKAVINDYKKTTAKISNLAKLLKRISLFITEMQPVDIILIDSPIQE